MHTEGCPRPHNLVACKISRSADCSAPGHYIAIPRDQSVARSKRPMPCTSACAIPTTPHKSGPHRPSRRYFNEKMPSGRIVNIPTYDGMKLKGTVYSAGENRPCVVMASGVCLRIPTLPTPTSVSSCGILSRPTVMEIREKSCHQLELGTILTSA